MSFVAVSAVPVLPKFGAGEGFKWSVGLILRSIRTDSEMLTESAPKSTTTLRPVMSVRMYAQTEDLVAIELRDGDGDRYARRHLSTERGTATGVMKVELGKVQGAGGNFESRSSIFVR
jgi:hypothetical protein